MNPTSFESLPSQYTVATLPIPAREAGVQSKSRSQALNLTSSPKFNFRAPTAEDFDKGSRAFMEEPASSPVLSTLAGLWSKLSCRPANDADRHLG